MDLGFPRFILNSATPMQIIILWGAVMHVLTKSQGGADFVSHGSQFEVKDRRHSALRKETSVCVSRQDSSPRGLDWPAA